MAAATLAPLKAGLLTAFCLVLLTGCGSGGSGGNSGACTVNDQNQIVKDAMEGRYFWNDEFEQREKYVDFAAYRYPSVDTLLDFLRYQPDVFDRFFTSVTTPEEDSAFFGPGQFIGYGFSFQIDETTDELWITQAFEGSPAWLAGFRRGLEIVSIDGDSVVQLIANGDIGAAFGASEVNVTQQFTLQAPGGAPFVTTATKQVVTINPVPQHFVIPAGNENIGYLEFRTFVSTAPDKLRDAFATFKAAGVRKVIVDVRYNGGGLISVADTFASLLAGPSRIGQVQSFTTYNQANSVRNQTTPFAAEANAIDLDTIVFITTESSASATELVINALEPYVTDVALVGSDTFGKPVGQEAFDFCDQRLRYVTFEIVNAELEGRYFSGLPVDCPAADDFTLPLGDTTEASLSTALSRAATGDCPILGNKGNARLQSVEPETHRRPVDATPAREFSYAY
jgi:carboxyl-terminal processing protease